MNISDVIAVEHGLLRVEFDWITNQVTANPSAGKLESPGAMVARLVESHARLEEELLFAALEPKLGAIGSTATAIHRDEHRKIERLFSEAGRKPSVYDALMEAVEFTRTHLEREEDILLPLTSKLLNLSHQERLGRSWMEARGARPLQP